MRAEGGRVGDRFLQDGHKLHWHLDRVVDWTRGVRIAPLHIDLGITTGCNIACTFCYGVIQGRVGMKNRYDMPRDAVLRLLRDAKEAGVRSIAFIGEGDNTLNPALPDALREAKRIDLDVSLATNGVLLTEEDLRTAMTTLKWLRFNLSASNAESFLKIHRTRDWDKVVRNVARAVEIKRTLGSATAIGLQMVVVHENVDDIVPLARLGAEWGVDYFVVKPCSDDPEKTLEGPTVEYRDMEPLFKEAEAVSNGRYEVVVKRTKMGNAGTKDYDVCYGTQFIIGISGNGNVFPCGHWFDVHKEEFLMGNVVEGSFREILASERYWEVQKKIQTINVHNGCETNCRQHYVNQYLWRLKHPPEHVNFV